jgi:hypothetical protein
MELQEDKNFVLRCEKDLPRMLMVDGVNYKLHAHELLGGGFRISYGEFDGDFFNWKNKPIDLFYNIVEILPPTKEYKEGELQDASIYKTNIDDVISDCLDKLKTWHNGLYAELNEIVPRETQFHRELSSLLNRYSKENGSNTPDFLLASYLTGCLHTFNSIVNAREEWYGRGEKRKEKDITNETQIGEQM